MYFGLSKQSFDSLKNQVDIISENTGNLPQVLSVFLDLKSEATFSEKAGKLKLMFKTLFVLLKESMKEKDVFFVLDDVKLLHKECLSVLGAEGHQVIFILYSINFKQKYFVDFLRSVSSLCANKVQENAFTGLVLSSSFSAHEFSKEETQLNLELDLLRNVFWNFDENVSNSIFSILKDSAEKTTVSQRKLFDCKIFFNKLIFFFITIHIASILKLC